MVVYYTCIYCKLGTIQLNEKDGANVVLTALYGGLKSPLCERTYHQLKEDLE